MSRRKQANPRSIQVFDEKNGTEDEPDRKLDLEQTEKMQTLQPLNVDVNLPTEFRFNLSSNLSNSNSEDGMSRVVSPGDNPALLTCTSPSTPSSINSPLPALDHPLPKLKDASKILPIPGSDGRSTYVCPMCKAHLSSNHDLTVHIRMHNAGNQVNQSNTCTICNKMLSSQSSLDRHMLVHSGERPFKCKICSMTFTTNGNMHRHSRIHQKNNNNAVGIVESSRTNKKSKTGWKNKTLPSSPRNNDTAMTEITEEPEKLPFPSSGNFDWDTAKSPVLPKGKMMPGYMPRHPMWPSYNPYLPFMQPHLQPVYPNFQLPMGIYGQSIACPLCSKRVLLVDYMNHLKIEHENESPFGDSLKPSEEKQKQEPKSNDSKKDEDVNSCMSSPGLSATPSSSPSPSPKSVKSGFEDIDFIDFTAPKFPLIAKAWCEQHERNGSNATPEFICKECGKAFPCQSALMLHTDSHLESRSHETSDIQSEDHQAQKHGEKTKTSFFSLLNLKPNESDTEETKVSIKVEPVDEEEPEKSPANTPSKETPEPSPLATSSPFFKSLLSFSVSNKAMNAQRGMLHADSPLAVSTSPASSILSGDGTGNDVHDAKATGLLCKFCEMVFPNQKLLSAHKRIHMGLSPYQCSMCSYSSADKSTLIRHFRTHNGERPFQCIICDYAFTTKANCERHVKKKHGKTDKSDIEKSIGYNKQTKTEVNPLHSFHSPDTVCKYCGEDFKFFRALKHHLRSHSSCRLKPFLCQKCRVGFSTKANCVRHIQKQHTDIAASEVEAFIQLNDQVMSMDIDSDGSQSENNAFNAASSIKVPSLHAIANPDFSPFGPNMLKHEMNRGEAPLDFSVKMENGSFGSPHLNDPCDVNEPMDLSVKKEVRTPEEKKPKQTETSPIQNNYQCPYCLRSFGVLSELSLHVQQVHDITPEKDTNNNRKWQQETSTPRKLPIMPFPIHPAFVKYSPYQNQAISALFSPGGFDSNSDLAPVNRMLTATHTQSFKPFLTQSPNTFSNKNSHSDSNDVDDEDNDNDLDNIGCDSDAFSEDLSTDKPDAVDGDKTPTSKLDNSSDFALAKSLDLPDTTVKKKRNSYADSPHKLACPYCPRSFPWVSSLNRHLLTHTGQKPFKCSQCPVTFSTKSNRERHLIRKHGVNMLDPASRQTMDRPYKCHLCIFSSFATKSNLLKHYSDRHPGNPLPDRLYRCDTDTPNVDDQNDDIRETFKEPEDEIEEQMQISSDNLSAEKCDVDEDDISPIKDDSKETTNAMSDDDLSASNMDLLSFGGSAEKHINPERDNYNVDKITHCWKCSEEFVSRKLLVRHLKEHNIDLPYKCYLCDASFDLRIECLRHTEKQHGSDWTILQDKNGVKNIEDFSKQVDNMVAKSSAMDLDDENKEFMADVPADSTRGEVLTADYFQRKVYCSLCPKRFWSLQDLRRHMRSHTGERPFECDICHKRFTLKHSMMRHRRKHGTAELDMSTMNEDAETFFSDEGSSIFPVHGQSLGLGMYKERCFKDQIQSNKQEKRPEYDDSDDGDKGDNADILQNLLGVDNNAINTMLDLKNSLDSTTHLLGMGDTD